MHWDFWNNPLVVTALRIRYRRGGLMSLLMAYFLLLATAGSAIFYYRDRIHTPFPKTYFLAVIGVQFLISFGAASSATALAVRNEVTTRTLDFQRIATLSPLQIFLGKLFGEPMVAYFTIVPTIPFTVYTCFILGLDGMDFLTVLLVYITLVTTSIVSGATGLLQPLDSDSPAKAKHPTSNFGAIIFGIFFCCIPALLAGGSSILATPWAAALLGFITPVPSWLGIYESDPWKYGLQFFDLKIPFLILTPLSQLAITGLILHVMIRRLATASRIIMNRAVAYCLLICCDAVLGGVFYQAPLQQNEFYIRTASYWLIHLIFALFLMTLITPTRQVAWSWSWRFRGRKAWLIDAVLGDRSISSVALVIMTVIGFVDYFAFIVGPANYLYPAEQMNGFIPHAVRIAIVCSVFFLSLGSLYQWLVLAFDRSGRSFYISILLLLILPVDLAGRYFQIETLQFPTPIIHFENWFKGNPSSDYSSLLILYVAILLICMYWTHRRQAAMNRVVDAKLRIMNVGLAPAGAVNS